MTLFTFLVTRVVTATERAAKRLNPRTYVRRIYILLCGGTRYRVGNTARLRVYPIEIIRFRCNIALAFLVYKLLWFAERRSCMYVNGAMIYGYSEVNLPLYARTLFH